MVMPLSTPADSLQDPDQGFESLVMYLTERDAGVRIWNVEVVQRPAG